MTAVESSLAVVVPIYDVEDYLRPCLDSVLAQARRVDQVVLVDDGSHDSSGAIADEYAAAHEGWQVVHVENGGLGRARNIGADLATTDYLAFLDSDDVVPPPAYGLLVEHLDQSGSDLALGDVMRYDGTTLMPSPLHRRAIAGTELGTTLSRNRNLMYDTTATNKVFRTEFWRREKLRFPEGVFYEDIPVTIPAYVLARSVDVVAEPVYWWRERQTATLSITQRRHEVRNFVDRMSAVETVAEFLAERSLDDDAAFFARKALTLDLKLYLPALLEADDEFRSVFVERAGAFAREAGDTVLRGLPALDRLVWWLVGHGHLPQLLEVIEQQVLRTLDRTVTRRPLRLTANLPFRDDKALGVPAWVYDVTNSQPMRAAVGDARWDGQALVLEGHAFVEQVPMARRWTSRLRLEARDRATTRSFSLPVTRVPDEEQTGATLTTATDYTWCGFVTNVDVATLAAASEERVSRYHFLAHLTTASARRGTALRAGRPGRASTPGARLLPDGTLAVAGWRDGRLELAVHRDPTYVRSVDVVDDGLALGLKLGARDRRSAEAGLLDLVLGRAGAPEVRLEVPSSGRVELAVAGVEPRRPGVPVADWTVRLVTRGAGEGSNEGLPVPLAAGPDATEAAVPTPGGELAVEVDVAGQVYLRDAAVSPRADDVSFEGGHLVVSGRAVGPVTGPVELVQHLTALPYPLEQEPGTDRWSVRVPLDGAPGSAALRRLAAGEYLLRVPDPARADARRPLRLTGALPGSSRAVETTVRGVRVTVAWDSDRSLRVTVDPAGPWSERGALRREHNAGPVYEAARKAPLTDAILFEAWQGRQYSDSPRAVFEELRRRGAGNRLVWSVDGYGVEVPDDVEVVLRKSSEYYRLLGAAAAVVTNDSLDSTFVKRPGQVYVQTWHGTPLLKIAHDVPATRSSQRDRLAELGKDVEAWDLLVSPNDFCTDVLPKAFRYGGEVLDAGAPRNDVFHHDEERTRRAAAVRERLGLDDGRTVVLYAPTWRESRYDATGRHLFDMRLDLEHLNAALADDAVVLVRGHQLVADSLTNLPFPRFVRNVSTYPDIQDLYLVADVLVTDYSSAAVDFANTGRPMLFFAYDLEQYTDDVRGFYVDYPGELPGPVLTDPDDVTARLSALVADPSAHEAEHAQRYEAFRRRFCGHDDGKASARVVDALLARLQAKR